MIFGKRTTAPEPVKVMVNGHDETARMPLTAAELARQHPEMVPAEPVAMPYVQTSDDPLAVGGPVPPSMGRVADLYADVRALRLLMEKEVEPIQARESQLREYLISNISKSDDTGAAGLRYRAQIVIKETPRAVDWPKIYSYIRENDRFDLVQKRLGEKAVADMLSDGQKIPGIEIAKIPTVSITKI